MSEHQTGATALPDERAAGALYKKDFWGDENRRYARPHYRLEKAARLINKIARDKACTLLDVGCGPATLRSFIRPTIDYHGIDIAIQEPAPYLLEADLIEAPIRFGDKLFDIVVAQGFFEYVGDHQSRKFAEIAQVLNSGGTFVASYVNFDHRKRDVYWPYSNVQPLRDFRRDLEQRFTVRRSFATSHNWGHWEPGKKIIRAANMHINVDLPVISRILGVEYFFVCSPRRLGDDLRFDR